MAAACLSHRLVADGRDGRRAGPRRPASSPKRPSPRREHRTRGRGRPGGARSTPTDRDPGGHRRGGVGPGDRSARTWPCGRALVGVVAMRRTSSWGSLSPHHRRARRRPGGRRRRRVHPVGWLAPVVSSVVAVLAWAGVAHSSGSGWVQAVGALLAAVLARRAGRPRVAGPPGQASPARPPRPTVRPDGRPPSRSRPAGRSGSGRRPTGAARPSAPPDRPGVPGPVEVTVTPDRRGVVDKVAVEVASCAPFGLLWWAKEVEVPLPRPLPRRPESRAGPEPMATEPDDLAGRGPARVPSGAGEPRGVRPYQPGDLRRSVHWPATSHVGIADGAGEGAPDRRPRRHRPGAAPRSRPRPRPGRAGDGAVGAHPRPGAAGRARDPRGRGPPCSGGCAITIDLGRRLARAVQAPPRSRTAPRRRRGGR